MNSEESGFLPDEIDFERALLRKSVGMQLATRPRCRDCGRTPLIGEQMYVYSHGKHVCELCSALRGTPAESSYPVRHGYAGHTVRILKTQDTPAGKI